MKHLGKITNIHFGMGGYQEVMIGLSITFQGDWGGISEFNGTWADPPSENAKWTIEEQNEQFSDAVRLLYEILKKTGKKKVQDLVGTPVEVDITAGRTLDSWRVLEEVL